MKKILSLSISFLFSSLFATLPDITQMTLVEKVGQTLMVHFQGDEVNEKAETLINELKVGSIIYYNWSNDLNSPTQVQSLSNGLQKLTQKNLFAIPLFIAVDQEGGPVMRLSKGFTQFPSAATLGLVDPMRVVEAIGLGLIHVNGSAEEVAFAMGEEMKAVGCNMNLAPIVDIASTSRSQIGVRTLGNNPDLVTKLATVQLEGYRKAGIVTSIKHFPGYGEIATDAHEDLPWLRKSKEELYHHELIPYLKLANQADTIMVGHLMVPALDPIYPASLSSTILQGLLREEIGYKGVILSDSLVMEGLIKSCHSIEEGALLSFNAGCDILILGGKQLLGRHKDLELTVDDVRRIENYLVDAVKEGRISEERLNQSVERILQLKEKANLFAYDFPQQKEIDEMVATEAHRNLAEKVSREAVKVIRKGKTLSELKDQKIVFIAPSILRDNIEELIANKLPSCKLYFIESPSPSDDEIKRALEIANEADALILASYQAWRNPTQAKLYQKLTEGAKPSFVIATRDPVDAELFPLATTLVTTLSPTLPSMEAALQKIENE